MALICIWLHIIKKAQNEHSNCPRPIPHNLKTHYEYDSYFCQLICFYLFGFITAFLLTRFLQHAIMQTNLSVDSDYRIVLLCNAYSTYTGNDYFNRSMAILFDSIQKVKKFIS